MLIVTISKMMANSVFTHVKPFLSRLDGFFLTSATVTRPMTALANKAPLSKKMPAVPAFC